MTSRTTASLAMDYFSDVSRGHARCLFNQMVLKMMKMNPQFRAEMETACYCMSARYVTPMQLDILFRYLGEP